VGEHFRGDGQPKRRFDTREEALAYIELYDYPCDAYPCDFCKGWHLATRRAPRVA
jgi:hypothetical protein